MGGAVTPALAAAVSNAGGLGMLPMSWSSPEEVAAVVEETGRRTERPFGVNLGLAWDQRERLALALEAGARVISFFWGDAGAVIRTARAAGALVFVTVGTAEEGGAAAAAGARVVVSPGGGAGGGGLGGGLTPGVLAPGVVGGFAGSGC